MTRQTSQKTHTGYIAKLETSVEMVETVTVCYESLERSFDTFFGLNLLDWEDN